MCSSCTISSSVALENENRELNNASELMLFLTEKIKVETVMTLQTKFSLFSDFKLQAIAIKDDESQVFAFLWSGVLL